MGYLKYLAEKDYKKLNPGIFGSDLEEILQIRKTSIAMQNFLMESNYFKNDKDYQEAVKNSIMPLANIIIKLKNGLFFNGELEIDESILITPHKLNSLISYQIAFINGKKLKIELFNEK